MISSEIDYSYWYKPCYILIMKKILIAFFMIGLFGCSSLNGSTCCEKKTECTKQTECCGMDHCDKTKCEGQCCDKSCCG